jgi:hypothetical protein
VIVTRTYEPTYRVTKTDEGWVTTIEATFDTDDPLDIDTVFTRLKQLKGAGTTIAATPLPITKSATSNRADASQVGVPPAAR